MLKIYFKIKKSMKVKIEIKQDSYLEVQKYFVSEVKKLINDDVVEIITNGNLAAVMQDSIGFKLSKLEKIEIVKDEDGKMGKYPLGSFLEKPLIVDPYMMWNDNRILFKSSNDNIDELEVVDEKLLLI